MAYSATVRPARHPLAVGRGTPVIRDRIITNSKCNNHLTVNAERIVTPSNAHVERNRIQEELPQTALEQTSQRIVIQHCSKPGKKQSD